MASIGTFMTKRPIRILDLANLPEVPGFFSTTHRIKQRMLSFLSDFSNLIIQPVERTDRINIDYIPTQVFTEFIRDFQFKGGRIDGIRYRSATGEKGANYVLFAGQEDVVDAAPSRPFSPRIPWLELVKVTHVRR